MHNSLKLKIPLMQRKLSIMIPWKAFCARVHWCTLHCLGHLLLQTIVLSAYDDWCHPPSAFLCPASPVWFVVERTPALFQLVLNLPFLTFQSHPATTMSFESNPAIFFHTHTHIYIYVNYLCTFPPPCFIHYLSNLLNVLYYHIHHSFYTHSSVLTWIIYSVLYQLYRSFCPSDTNKALS